MSKKITSTVAVALALTMACGSALAEFKDFTVNGQKITKAVQERVAAQTIATSPNPHSVIAVPDIEAQVKDMITDMVVMAQYAKKKGLDKNPDVQADMQSAVDSVLWQAAVDDYLKANPVTEKEMRAAYDKEAARWGKTEYQIRHIMVKTEKEAQDLIAQIQKGASFEKLAQEKSIDESSKEDGGLLDWQSPSVFTGELSVAIPKLKKGVVDPKPIQSAGGWHVVELQDSRPQQLFPKYETRKKELERTLQQRKIQDFVHSQVIQAEIK